MLVLGADGWGTTVGDGKETRKHWGEQAIACSPKVYRNLSVESGGSSEGLERGAKD